jgi:uncharacterized membrane protein (DUF106 family)
MNYLAELSSTMARLLDLPLGWLLTLPRDAAIVLVAAGTSLIMTLARKWCTNQDLLRRTKDDLARLKSLAREAKRNGDKAAVLRTRSTVAAIKTMRLRADGIVLAVSLAPLAMLAMWAAQRLEYFPPRVGEELMLQAQYPLSSVDTLTHLVPPSGVKLNSPALQLVQVDPLDPQHGMAHWKFVPETPVDSLPLVVRHAGDSVTHLLNVGGQIYSPPVQMHVDVLPMTTTVELRQAKFLGRVPGFPQLGLAPWLVAYVLLSVALVPLLRRVLNVS